MYPNCNDSNLLDNSAEKMFIVKSGDNFVDEIETIYKKAEKVLNDNIIESIYANHDFKKNTIKEVEQKIKRLEIEYCKDDLKYDELLNIIKLLLNIIKYNN